MGDNKTRRGLLPWIGGKNRLSKQIVSAIEQIEQDSYIEPFCDAAHVFFRKEPSKNEILNDVNGHLINFYRVLRNHPEELYRGISETVGARDLFEQWEKGGQSGLTDIQRATRFYYCQRWGYGGRCWRRTLAASPERTRRINYAALKGEMENAVARIKNALIENLDWEEVFRRFDRKNTLFYVDPPYFNCENYYGKGIFERGDFERMSGIFKALTGAFILSINDRPEIRDMFGQFEMHPLSLKYSVSNNDRNKTFKELLITNRPFSLN